MCLSCAWSGILRGVDWSFLNLTCRRCIRQRWAYLNHLRRICPTSLVMFQAATLKRQIAFCTRSVKLISGVRLFLWRTWQTTRTSPYAAPCNFTMSCLSAAIRAPSARIEGICRQLSSRHACADAGSMADRNFTILQKFACWILVEAGYKQRSGHVKLDLDLRKPGRVVAAGSLLRWHRATCTMSQSWTPSPGCFSTTSALSSAGVQPRLNISLVRKPQFVWMSLSILSASLAGNHWWFLHTPYSGMIWGWVSVGKGSRSLLFYRTYHLSFLCVG